MSALVQPVYAKEVFPTEVEASIFLAGPTPRNSETRSWRGAALNHLEQLNFRGHVFLPEPRDGVWSDYEDQVEWETAALNRADAIVFWVPRDLATDSTGALKMPGFTTNCEWGEWKTSGKVIWGAPRDAAKIRYEETQAAALKIPMFRSLPLALELAVVRLGKGALRTGGECTVPLHLWKDPTFQSWLQSKKKAGNTLLDVKLLAQHPITYPPILWLAQTTVRIEKEARNKQELVVGRKDLSVVVLFHRPETSKNMLDTEVVLVREYRGPARNSTGYVWEPPGGSPKTPKPPLENALAEVWEETGLRLPAERLKPIGTRQIASTLSAHVAHVFAAEITNDELANLKAQVGIAHGESGSTERCFVEVRTVRKIVEEGLVDWSMLGTIMLATTEV